MIKKALLAAAITATSFSASADVVKIAIAGPTTGPVAQYGDMAVIGAQMAVAKINEAGGFDGHTLEAVIYDDACDPKQATVVANKIVNDGISFVVGHLCSSSTQPASDIYEEEGVLMITAASTSPDITEQGKELVFRTIGRDDQQGPFAAKFIAQNIKPSKVAVVHDKQQYGEGIAKLVQEELKAAGVNVALFEGVTAGEKDYSALVSKLKSEGVDFVYYGGYHPELGAILRQAHDAKLGATFMGPEGVSNKEIISLGGDGAQGLIATQPKAFNGDAKNAELVKSFEMKKQDASGPFVLPAYAAVQAMADAMDATDSVDPEAVAAQLRSGTKVDSPIGMLTWDAKGDIKDAEFEVVKWSLDETTEKLN